MGDTAEAIAVRRDTAAAQKPENASQTISEALESFQEGVNKFVKNVQVGYSSLLHAEIMRFSWFFQDNELFQNVTQSLKSFSEQLQVQGKQLVDKIQNSTKTEEKQ